jgi:uncharacterized protein (TIGR02001 family)
MMKKTLIATALMAAISTTALADGISGNVALTSDYVFRGVSQTDNQMAIQGGLDYEHPSGLYVGTWASNVNSAFFNDPTGDTPKNYGIDPQIELDLYGGFKGDLGNGIGYDVGYIRYQYPGYSKVDTNEIYVKGSFKEFSASLNYSDELKFLPSSESAWYLAAGYDTTLPVADVGLSVHVGYSFGDAFDVSTNTATTYGLPDSYTDWSVGLSKSLMGVDLGLTYTDNNLSNADCDLNICDSKVVFSVSKSL